tara:strand:+ start:417 stop:824 length:408 start_codon:yes stop_codon:yes gene_type:complete
MEKYSWEFMTQFSINNPPKITIYRDSKTETRYKYLKTNLKKKGISISDYLKTKLFSGYNKFKEYRFIENDFKYNTEDGVFHYNFWINPIIETNYDENKIKDIVAKIMKNKDFIIFKNLVCNMSVPGVVHYHIFYR